MVEEDLARPLVEVRDFETGRLEYEIYTYGEENVVIPVEKMTEETAKARTKTVEAVREAISEYDEDAEVEALPSGKVVVRVDRDVIPRLIGRHGENITRLERQLGASIEVEPKLVTLGREVDFEVRESGNTISLVVGGDMVSGKVNVYVDNEYLFSATIGRKGVIKVSKRSENGRALVKAIYSGRKIRLVATG